MTELIAISVGIVGIGIVLYIMKTSRAMFKEIIKDGFHTTEITIKKKGNGEKELLVNGKNGKRTVVVQ